ncbi:uncharacterized protein K02A2.6-like [Achroia grisella]|uniref:uncharacterized protein K02A2.6-like n=1 Tax=Achroia grisella TaxID=688607 RepID=UPI0027D2F0B6|nr:uncharacterized protein K02A2.6-like [Achroia grisella]
MEDSWKIFQQKLEIFLLASGNDSKSGKIKTAILLSLIGDRGLRLYNTFVYDASKNENKDDFELILSKFEEHFTPQKNITYERYKFFSRNQKPDETYEDYIACLRDLSMTCEFGALAESLIKDRLVCGISDITVKDRLLRTRDLSLIKAEEICRASQETKMQIQQLCANTADCNGGESSGILKLNRNIRDKVDIDRKYESSRYQIKNSNLKVKTFLCKRCGYEHIPQQCPAFNKRCLKCQRYNHFARQCQVKTVEVDESEHEIETIRLGAVFIHSLNGNKDWVITVGAYNQGNLKELKLKVDTGAQANVLRADNLPELGGDIHNLLITNSKLTTYTGTPINCLGKTVLDCKYNGNVHKLEFFIVDCERACNIIGLQSSAQLKIINPEYSMGQVSCEQVVMTDYKELFVGLGCMKEEYDIKLKENVSPVVHASRRVPLAIQPRLKKKLEELERIGVISKVQNPTEWVNSLVIVYKPNGDLRLCIDPKDLNEAIQRQHFELPTFDEISSKLSGANIFSTLDIKNGFWNIKLTQASSDLCCFNTPFGRYKFLRMPFGICSAPEIYQHRMRQMLEGLEGVEVYIDDILIWGKDESEHEKRLRKVFERLQEGNVKLNKEKCKIGVSELKYLGHIISQEGIQLGKDRIQSILDMKSPKNRKELERFLGVVNYISKFVPNFAIENAPLRNLLKKDVEFDWNESHEESFNRIKSLLVKKPVLQFFNEKLPILLSVDSSKYGLGAVLLQNNLPVAYASKALNECQNNYAQIEKELLAILFGCEKFNQFIYGRKITIETDHSPLVSLVKKPLNTASPRIQRMLIKLQKYQFDLVYKRGRELYLADTLSRSFNEKCNSEIDLETEEIEAKIDILLCVVNISDRQLGNIRELTAQDNELKTVKGFIKNGWPCHRAQVPDIVKSYWNVRNELIIKSGIILKNTCLVIPHKLRHEMLSRIHYPHLGITKSLLRAQEVMYWPVITIKKEPLVSHSVPDSPWQKVAVDIFELGGNSYLLAVDYYSKYPELCYLESTTSTSVIINLKRIFSRNGIPETLISDGGPQFSSTQFKEFSIKWEFDHIFSSPEHAQSNGMVERTIQSVKRLLCKSLHENKDPFLAMLEFRNTPIAHNIPSPAENLFNRKLRGILPSNSERFKPKVSIKPKLIERTMMSERNYNRNKVNLKMLQPGDVVLFKVRNEWRKGVIKSQRNARSYFIESDNRVFLRNRFFIKILPSVPYYIPDEEDNKVTVTTTTGKEIIVNSDTATDSASQSARVQTHSDFPYITRSGRIIHRPQRYDY